METNVLEELNEECGVAALYWLDRPAGPGGAASSLVVNGDVAALMPSMLLDLQNRGQLAAGLSSWNPRRPQILDTHKRIGTVIEAFRMSRPDTYRELMADYSGPACIGHTRYATCGLDDKRYAQPFERHHGRMWKWFSFAFNGNLANYTQLRQHLLSKRDYVFTLNTDTEIIMHSLAYRLRGDRPPVMHKVMASMSRTFDGAYNLVFLDAMGRMFISRDPMGFRPLSWSVQGRLFAAASESVALTNMGFTDIRSLAPGEMAMIENGRLTFRRYARPRRSARCFFEWVYFSSVASQIDGSTVYTARSRLGRHLADLEDQKLDSSCIVVPVPDTAKAAADAFAFRLGLPCLEGLIRNRYVGRTFIQPNSTRKASAKSKYTPLPAVLKGKRVFLIEDSIVRSTTLAVLARRLRAEGGAKEVHVRVSCPPIVSPCFYGIDMSTLGELFAPRFCPKGYRGTPTLGMFRAMAKKLELDSLRYLSVSDLGTCLGVDGRTLCTGCVTAGYPTEWGNRLLQSAKRQDRRGGPGRTRTYE
ncbi:MAG: amidophosphoribosyltransferase [Planctomycetes bacterium]|nr:amidophosphoribosyltransferase [Planctomycetota bacterium]